jgi:hypothetical protein
MSEHNKSRSERARGAEGRGRGHGGRGRGRSGFRGPAEQNQSLGDVVPTLRFGPDNNFSKFKEKLARAAMERYGDLSRLIETDEYFEPDKPNVDDYDLADDEYGINVAEYKDALKEYRRAVNDMKNNRSKLYAMIEGKLSVESLDEVKRHENYETFHIEKDPLELWKAVKEIHLVSTTCNVEGVVKKTARDSYNRCHQGAYESIISYKERFDAC